MIKCLLHVKTFEYQKENLYDEETKIFNFYLYTSLLFKMLFMYKIKCKTQIILNKKTIRNISF
jgi:hypothetical protein